jgi:general secretion pathway protein H
MGPKVEQAQDKTSRAGCADWRAADGFTLIEVVAVVAIVAILAAIVVPGLPRGTSRARLEGYAVEAAAVEV